MIKMRIVGFDATGSFFMEITEEELSLIFDETFYIDSLSGKDGSVLLYTEEHEQLLAYIEKRDFNAKIQKVLNDSKDM
jgi:hypothetical protein